jgi:hypothetical protein
MLLEAGSASSGRRNKITNQFSPSLVIEDRDLRSEGEAMVTSSVVHLL